MIKIKISFKSKHRIKGIDDKRTISITFYDCFFRPPAQICACDDVEQKPTNTPSILN
ncbi:MAG: hypothetical protein ACI8QG_003027, partial [Flavobacteriales bacterium]